MALVINTLGNSDVAVTEMGFGGAPMGGVGPIVTEEQVTEILLMAWDNGIRYFDTAPLYGHGLSERRLGGFLSTLPRDEFTLSSKVGRLLVPADQGERDDKMHDHEPFGIRYDYSYNAARQSLEASFARLGLSSIDVVLCHDIDVWTHGDGQPEVLKAAREGILPALSDLKREGVVRAIGLGVNEWPVCNQIMDEFDVDCFLLAGRFTLLEQEPLDLFLPRCREKNVSIIIGGPFNSGLLANVERRRATYDYKPVDDAKWGKAQEIRRVCESHNVDMRAAALQYPLKHPAVASVIPGMWRIEEVRTNIKLMSAELPDSLWTDLAAEGLVRLDGIDR